jgi:hypothetical protein
LAAMMDKVGEMDAATLPDLDQLDSKALKSLILELHDQVFSNQ